MASELENLDIALPDDLVAESLHNGSGFNVPGGTFCGSLDSFLNISQRFAHAASMDPALLREPARVSSRSLNKISLDGSA
jgi:hypothetical protein